MFKEVFTVDVLSSIMTSCFVSVASLSPFLFIVTLPLLSISINSACYVTLKSYLTSGDYFGLGTGLSAFF